MKIDDAKSIVDLIRNSTFGEIFFTSIIILPIYLASWILTLKLFNKKLWNEEITILVVLISGYIITLLILKFYQTKDQKIERASMKIRAYILSRNWTRMSFDRILTNIDTSYDSELLKLVLDKYPLDFRKGTIKGGKIAIVILGEESENN